MAEAKVKWAGKGEFIGTDSTKHSLIMSTQDDENATGLKPSELLLISLAGCTGVDVVSILKKSRQDLTGLEIEVTGEHDSDPPWKYRKIHLEYRVRGRGLSERTVERAIRLSEEKFCSVRATISETTEITHSYIIIEDE